MTSCADKGGPRNADVHPLQSYTYVLYWCVVIITIIMVWTIKKKTARYQCGPISGRPTHVVVEQRQWAPADYIINRFGFRTAVLCVLARRCSISHREWTEESPGFRIRREKRASTIQLAKQTRTLCTYRPVENPNVTDTKRFNRPSERLLRVFCRTEKPTADNIASFLIFSSKTSGSFYR